MPVLPSLNSSVDKARTCDRFRLEGFEGSRMSGPIIRLSRGERWCRSAGSVCRGRECATSTSCRCWPLPVAAMRMLREPNGWCLCFSRVKCRSSTRSPENPKLPIRSAGSSAPIDTHTPGIEISEHLPLLAQRSHLWDLCQSLTHRPDDHDAGHTKLCCRGIRICLRDYCGSVRRQATGRRSRPMVISIVPGRALLSGGARSRARTVTMR